MSRAWVRAVRHGVIFVLLLPVLPAQATDKPRFDKYHVVPHGSYGPRTVAPGQFVSILGWNLTPTAWCDAPHSTKPPYPLALCGVRVLVGGRAAGLMYAGPPGNGMKSVDQINFQVPADVEAEGEAPIQICVAARCSEPLNVPFTRKDILLRVEGKAQVHMPLWVEFEIPLNVHVGYPAGLCPWKFGGFQIEVRKDGKVLPSRPAPKCADGEGEYSATRVSRVGAYRKLPVHLYHVFHTPGEYEIRMSGPLLTPDLSRVSRIGYSDWIRVTVEPFADTKRQLWLDTVARAAKGGQVKDETEVIVSLLALPNEQALKTLLNFLPPSPPPASDRVLTVSGGVYRARRTNHVDLNWTRNCLAVAALAAFPDAMLKKFVPPTRLANLKAMPGFCRWR